MWSGATKEGNTKWENEGKKLIQEEIKGHEGRLTCREGKERESYDWRGYDREGKRENMRVVKV